MKHGLLKVNVMHVEMSFDQMFMFRPVPEMSAIVTIDTYIHRVLHVTLGEGVFGVPGYNAARGLSEKREETFIMAGKAFRSTTRYFLCRI